MRTCVLFLVCPLPRVLCFLPRLTVPLPALPDVYLSAQREVQVQPCATSAWGSWSHPTTRHPSQKLRGIYFIDPEDKEFKETIKNARKKLETSVAPAMPCKVMKNCGNGGSDKNKTKLACILARECVELHG